MYMYIYIYIYAIEILKYISKISLFSSILVFAWLTLAEGGTSIKLCSGFLNLLYKRYPAIANPATPTLLIYR